MRILLASVAVAGILGCADGAQPGPLAPESPRFSASAFTDRTLVVLVDATVINSCTGEAMRANGPITIVFHVTNDAAGGLHLSGSAHLQGVSAVGVSSGTTYHIVGKSARGFDGVFNSTPGGTQVSTFQLTQLWVSDGSASNLQSVSTFVFVINANGDVTADVSLDRFLCRG